ncbi:MAG: hypothetical protein NTX44_00590 [Ignavibacteriales bacterium]|nr:hypothetical protein [Ignavibacteriales bacterium]
MKNNGKYFFSVVNKDEFISSVWDPYVYKRNGNSYILSDFATLSKPTSRKISLTETPYQPIEYRDIPEGDYLSFSLREQKHMPKSSFPIVGENELLFGTMRAYLANIIITPLSSWVQKESPIYFPIKSEFLLVSPHDKLSYFWLAFLRSHVFLDSLPLGSGGTRPRLHLDSLGQTPVLVPPLHDRLIIHNQLKELAMNEWQNYCKVFFAINSLNQK